MSENLKNIPEFTEASLGESIIARSDVLSTFHELGPPDLCHIIKVDKTKPVANEIGSYHYVSGIDASSSAYLAAYLNSLTYAFEEGQAWFNKSNPWRIRSGIYCCYNAFSKVDVRVEVKIPGGVESYYVDTRGERHEATPDIWQETYLSGILRAILYSDDTHYRLVGYRKIDPITNLSAETRFLEAVEALFFKGWQLGSKPEIQIATSVHNFLTDGVMKYFGDSFRYDPAIALFTKLHKNDPEVGALLARAYIGQNEEIKAVKSLFGDLEQISTSYALLHAQADFLRGKGEFKMALKLAKYAVDTTPSEFLTWSKLTEIYIDLKDYKNALLTLNSCPMFTYKERDMHRMPVPAKTHLPINPDIISSGIMEEDTSNRESEADSNLSRLPAPALHGTFAKAYAILTQIASALGWDELLRCRSQVFVMEEEYRMHKQKQDRRSKTSLATLSQEQQHEQENDDGDNKPLEKKLQETSLQDVQVEVPKLAKAVTDENNPIKDGEVVEEVVFSFSNKRLCERWLDNLFMVLYEDLRVYTFWMSEAAHCRAQQMPYRKTGTEWELLGDLSLRLCHENESKEAYELCLDHKFSAKAWMRLLEIYAKEGNTQKALLAAVKLTVYHERWYHEIVYPSEIARNLNSLIRKVGLSKMQNILSSMNLPKPVQKLMIRYFDYGELFKVEGYEL